MKQKKKHYSGNPFTGRWSVIKLYFNRPGQEWVLLKIYRRNSFIMEFTEIRNHMSYSGGITYSGKMRELSDNRQVRESYYTYDSEAAYFYIDRWEEDGNGKGRGINLFYRVQRTGEDSMWLSEQEDVDYELFEYGLKMKIRRLK